MLNFLDKYNLIKGQTAFGVELVLTSKDSFTLIALELTKKDESLGISRRFIDITLEQLVKENTKKIPIYISIGGKGIIHKKIKINERSVDQELLNQVLPNAGIKDFYIQTLLLPNYEGWVSVVRKDVLNVIINKIIELNLYAVEIYLGPFVLENCITLVNRPTLLTTTHELLIENNNIIQLDGLGSVSAGEEYNIEGEVINSHELIAFSAALSHFIPVKQLIPIISEKIAKVKEEYFYKNKYVVVGFSMIVLFFIIAVGNLFMSNSYQTTNNELQYQVESKKKYIVELETLRAELTIKEQFVQNSGVTRASKISYYADQIALSIPSSIQLNQLFINPLEKRVNKAEDILFNYNKIKVAGTVNRSIELNNWIKELKQYEWIADITIVSFVQDNLRTAGEFEIEIDIN